MKKYIIIAILLCCSGSPAYSQLSNFLNKSVDQIATVRNASTLLDSLFFTSTYSQAIFDIIASLQQYGTQAGNYSDLAAALTAASADTASLIVSERHNITTNTTLSGMSMIVAQQGARFNISSGITLTFADSVDFWAGGYKVFEGSGSVSGLHYTNPLWWGGKTEASIASAISAIDSGIVFIPTGIWAITDTLQLKSNIIIQGAGVGVTILDRALKSIDGGLFDIRVQSNISIRDLTIRGHAKNSGAYTEFMHGIFIADAQNIWVQNVEIENVGGDAISIAGSLSESVFIYNNTISVPNVTSSPDTLVGRNGISVVGGKNLWIVSNHIKDSGTPGGIDIEPSSGDSAITIFIFDNIITSPGSGSIGNGINLIETSETETIKNIFVERNDVSNYDVGIKTSGPDSAIVIKNNKVHHNATWGILITGSDNVLVEGNEVYKNITHGIEASLNQENIHIIDNRVSFNGGWGIDVFGSSGAELRNTVISGNVIWNNSQTTNAANEGLLVTFADSTIISNNIIYNDLGITNRQKYAITFTSNDGIILSDNVTWNNSTGETSQSTNTNVTIWGNSFGWDTAVDFIRPGDIQLEATGSNNITMDTNGIERVVLTSSGNFHLVVDTETDILSVGPTASENVYLSFNSAGNLGVLATNSNNDDIQIGGGSTKVGVGTASPQSDLDVSGGITSDTYNFAADGQADDDYEIALPGISALTTGLMVTWTATTANTAGATLEITSVGDIDALLKGDGVALATGDITAGLPIIAFFNAAGNWIIMSRLASD